MRPTLSQEHLHDLQGVLVHGYGHLPAAHFERCTIDPARAVEARVFFSQLALTNVITAQKRDKAHGPFTNVAFTHAGLRALRLDEKLLDTFPREFVDGPAAPTRARMLGDTGTSAPSAWEWGADTLTHAVLMLYATDDPALQRHASDVKRDAEASGITVRGLPPTKSLPRRQEHFGFRDGIAQPMMRGARHDYAGDIVAPGEILLGHEDEFGEVSHVPIGSAFVHGASYMVLRQLEQDVAGFWRFCRDSAPGGDPIRFAAQMVGRWPSGAPLVDHPEADPGTKHQDDDDFLYKADPRGERCPLGAHIRRSNPRDGFTPRPADSLRLVARHRMIRRGRAYGEPLCADAEPESYLKRIAAGMEPDTGNRGLHFVCFNANLERQFEFVQQQWCENPKLGGAVNGSDPLIGSQRPNAGQPAFKLVGKSGDPARHVGGLTRFVHVRGGAYFLLPTVSAVRALPTLPLQ